MNFITACQSSCDLGRLMRSTLMPVNYAAKMLLVVQFSISAKLQGDALAGLTMPDVAGLLVVRPVIQMELVGRDHQVGI